MPKPQPLLAGKVAAERRRMFPRQIVLQYGLHQGLTLADLIRQLVIIMTRDMPAGSQNMVNQIRKEWCEPFTVVKPDPDIRQITLTAQRITSVHHDQKLPLTG
ncbi:hypothetical protein [Xenorhabdus doucetiae]|uniref:hypothetical protein n=1 Tax=Xenorhabdus doucetiae TaxID=351671 RepID=UPI002B405402|nr:MULTISPECIES: hypothetical protein [unclassified Xenorhabdus]